MERNENGYSGFFERGGNDSERRRNGACPGTGELWRGGNANGQMRENGNENFLGDVLWEDTRAANNTCSKHQLAMVYSPHQCWRKLYAPDKALMRGTLFEELDKPLEDCTNG
jgi:hypothetical protein